MQAGASMAEDFIMLILVFRIAALVHGSRILREELFAVRAMR